MKKLLAIVVLGLLLSGNAYAKWLPNKDKDFFISCVAKGYHSWAQERYPETLLDEYKITIGEHEDLGRFPKSTLIVNTNATKQNKFELLRKNFDQSISYSNRIMIIDANQSFGKLKLHQEAVISLISGVYEVFYKDSLNYYDTVQFKGIGSCKGLASILSYLENNSKKSFNGNKNKGGNFLKSILKAIN